MMMIEPPFLPLLDLSCLFFPEFLIGNAASGLQFLRIATLDNNTFYQEVKKEWKQMLVFHATFSIGKGKIMSFPFLKDPVIFYDIESQVIELSFVK